MKYVFLRAIAPRLIAAILRLLRWTVRIEYRGSERIFEFTRQKRFIAFAFWHADMVLVLYTACDHIRRGVGRCAILASLSEDGELMARTLQRFAIGTVRGSSTHGARSGLKGLERYLTESGHVGIAVDGPLGPRRSVKVGIALLARNAGAPIIPFSVRYERSWHLRSWDRTEIPKPFSRCVVTFHEPIPISPTADRDELERVRACVERTLLGGATESRP